MPDLTPDALAGLRRLLDEGSARPWVAFRANDPNPGGRGWVGVTRDIDVDYDPDIFASQRCAPRDAVLIAYGDMIRAPGPWVRASGSGKKPGTSKSWLNLAATSRVSSRCWRWSSPTGTSVAL